MYAILIINVICIMILGFRWNNGCFIRTVIFSLLPIQRMVAYSFYILRLNITFEGSIFMLSSSTITIIITLLIITTTVSFTPTIIIAYLINDFSCRGEYTKYLILFPMIYAFVDILWCLILSVLYIKKLRQLIRNVDAKNEEMMLLVHKLTVLAFVTVLSTLLVTFIVYRISGLRGALSNIDLIFNNICIMLSFPVLNKSYQIYCCCCIKIQYKCCIEQNKPEIGLCQAVQYNNNHKISNTLTKI